MSTKNEKNKKSFLGTWDALTAKRCTELGIEPPQKVDNLLQNSVISFKRPSRSSEVI